MISLGVADTIGSYLFGFIVKYAGRVPCFLIAAVINYSMICVMIFWQPNEGQTYMLFVIPIFWGLGDAVWQTQINGNIIQINFIIFKSINLLSIAFYGVLFQDNKEAGFSNYRLW